MRFRLDSGKEIKETTLQCVALHYRDVVFPKVNDLIYRRKLLLKNSSLLKKTLEDVRDKLVSRFNDLYDFPNARLRRDMLLLFLTREELESRLSFEIKNLPKDQDPTLVDTYSLILQLKKVQAKNPPIPSEMYMHSTSDIIRERIREQFEILESQRITTMDTSWLKYKIIEDGRKVGMTFLAKTKEDAEGFMEELETCCGDDKKYHSLRCGLRALSFLEDDPVLMETSFIREEKRIIDQIFDSSANSDTSGISLLQRVELEEIRVQDSVPETYDISEELQ